MKPNNKHSNEPSNQPTDHHEIHKPNPSITPHDASRRAFVKKSLAAGIIAAQPTILAGLIRADGGGGGGETTTDPWGTTYQTTFNTTYATTYGTTYQTTSPWGTTYQTTYGTTYSTTVPPNNQLISEEIKLLGDYTTESLPTYTSEPAADKAGRDAAKAQINLQANTSPPHAERKNQVSGNVNGLSPTFDLMPDQGAPAALVSAVKIGTKWKYTITIPGGYWFRLRYWK